MYSKLSRGNRHGAESLDRHVGQCEESVENDAELGLEVALVVALQLILGRWQARPLGVVNQVQNEPRVVFPVAERVETLQRSNA